jgi:integration host factor subunit alpha
MTKNDLAKHLHAQASIEVSMKDALMLVDVVVEEIKAALAAGEQVKIARFGILSVRDKRERAGRNPRDGSPITISARRVVSFRASPVLKMATNL